MAQTIAIERVDHIGIRVRDLERALAFYRALGFTLAHRAVGDDVAIVRNEHSVELNLIFLTWCCVVLLSVLSLLPAQQMVRTGLPGRLEHFVA